MTTINSKSLKNNIGQNTNFVYKQNTLPTASSDINIYNVQQNQLELNNYIYDGVTIMHINSTNNQNSNFTMGQYFDQLQNISSFNSNNSFLKNLNIFQLNNIQLLNITNKDKQINNNECLFMSLTSEPYTNLSSYYNPSPNYSTTSHSSTFTFQSQYYFQATEQVILVKLIFTINNTHSLNTQNTNNIFPSISVNVINQVFTKDNIIKNEMGKIYQNTSILRYSDNPNNFDSTKPSYFLYNNVPLIIAPNFEKEFITLPILYVPPILNNGVYYGQYLPPSGYYFNNGIMNFNSSELIRTQTQTNNGHFVVGIAYQMENEYVSSLMKGINAEITVKTIWNSPLSLYNNYNSYSTLDLETVNVILLSANNINGGQSLVVNSGTPISSITKFGITSLSNFMSIMNLFIKEDDGTIPLLDYFTNQNRINIFKTKGYNLEVVVFETIYDTNIIYNPTNYTLHNTSYILLHSNNTENIIINPYNQKVIYKNVKKPYFGFENSVLVSIGNLNYSNVELKMITTNNKISFGNALFIGEISINGKNYYTLITLPESGFTPNYNVNSQKLTVFATDNSIFYKSTSASSSTQFTPNSIKINLNNVINPISNIVLTVSNEQVL